MDNINITFVSFEVAAKELFNILALNINDFRLEKSSYHLNIDFIDGLVSDKHQYKSFHPKTNLADLDTLDFLNIIVGEINNDMEIIMVTHQCYRLKYCFKSNWSNISRFCNNIYAELFKGMSFVQEHDYVFLIPQQKRICFYSHNNFYGEIQTIS